MPSARHETTTAEPSGAGAATQSKTNTKAKARLWDLTCEVPKATPPAIGLTKSTTSAETAAAIELEISKALRALRRALDGAAKDDAETMDETSGSADHTRALTFERWRWAAKFEEEEELRSGKQKKGAMLHPVVPSRPNPKAAADLKVELERQGLTTKQAEASVASLLAASTAQAARLLKLSQQAKSGKPLALPQEVVLTFNHHNIDCTCGHKVQVKLSRAAYGKLAILHRRHAPSSEAVPPPSGEAGAVETYEDDVAGMAEERAEVAMAIAAKNKSSSSGGDGNGGDDADRTAFHHRLFAMGLRYKSILGAGFQAAIGRPVWLVLRQRLGVTCEGFASPLNAYLPAFGSGFADVDGPFGSRGSFFTFKAPLSGSFEVNPPFVHEVMDAAATHMLSLLTAAKEAQGDHALSFAVILPGWKESKAFQMLSSSKDFLRRKILIAAQDHGFCDGAAHHRQDPFRHSPFDTAVFILQTDKAHRKWPADDKFEVELRAAFAECVPSEAAVRRQLKHSAGAEGKMSGGESKKRHRDEGGGGSGDKKKPRRHESGGGSGGGGGGGKHSAEVERDLSDWVKAKRQGNFEKADEIRERLRGLGVAAEKERPYKKREKKA